MLKAELIGNLGADAARQQQNDKFFVAMNVGVSYKKVNKATGEITDVTQWVSVTLNGDGGKLLQYLKCGAKVFIRGMLSTKLYTGHDGQQHAGINVSATEIELCGGKKEKDDVPF